MTATAAKKKPGSGPETQTGGNSVADQLAAARAELATVNRFLEKIQTFSNVVGDAKSELKELQEEEREVAEKLAELRDRIKQLKQSIDCASDGMLALIEPGPMKFMPLFDQMEKASPTKHGTNAAKWRELPLSTLKLSPVSTSLLYEADILFIGQLQDRIIDCRSHSRNAVREHCVRLMILPGVYEVRIRNAEPGNDWLAAEHIDTRTPDQVPPVLHADVRHSWRCFGSRQSRRMSADGRRWKSF